MDSYFRSDAPVLYYGLSAYLRPKKQQYVLWPALSYRVIAPLPKERMLNTFQKTVLGLCHAGEYDPKRIADLLHLDIDLINLVLQELQGRAWLDSMRRLTASGVLVLNEDRAEFQNQQELKVGYVYLDPWHQKLWPRFEEQLNFVDMDLQPDKKYPVIDLGTKGKPRRKRPFVKRWPSVVTTTTPTTSDILEAVKLHRRAEGRRQSGLCSDEETETSAFEQLPSLPLPSLDKVLVISDEPMQVYLTTFLYTCNEAQSSDEWYVRDPFKWGPSRFMKNLIREQVESDRELEECLGRLTASVDTDDQVQVQDDRNIQNELAEEEVRKQLKESIYSQLMPEVTVSLIQIERIRQFGDASTREIREDMLVRGGRFLEMVFANICKRYPPSDSWQLIQINDRLYREQFLNELASYLGYATPIPTNISRVIPNGVRTTSECDYGSLQQRAATALLTARDCPNHPLRRAGIHAPDTLNWIGQIIELQNMAAHDSYQKISDEDVSKQLSLIYDVLRSLLA